MNRFTVWALFLLVLVMGPAAVMAQCCDVPNGDPYVDNIIVWDGADILNTTVSYNGTLFVEGDMRIFNSTVTMEGKGIVVNTTGSLTIVDSIITSGSPEHGFYIDLIGDAIFKEVTLEGCIDEENGYFGIYIEGASLTASDLVMERSGMIRLDGGDLDLEGARVPGLLSYSGNAMIKDTDVEMTGITHYGPGKITVEDSTVTTNLSFSQTAGISVMNGGDLEVDGLTLGGSFNAGIHALESTVSLRNSVIDITDGLFGLSASDTALEDLHSIRVSGVGTGIELVNCSSQGSLASNQLEATFIGLNFQGNNPLTVVDTTIEGSTYGITSSAPLTLSNISFLSNEVGLLIEDGSAVNVTGCRFEDFGQWAIEDETWSERSYPENHFDPSDSSIGLIAWWGWLEIDVIGPGGIPVLGADIVLRSSLGSSFTVQATDVGAIWGYRKADGGTGTVNYTVEAKWGTARKDLDFVMEKGKTIEVMIPLTDISVRTLEIDDGMAVVTVHANRSAAREIMVEIFVDGANWNHEIVEVQADSERTVNIVLPDLDEGTHNIEARISSRDEYSGMNGYLQANNAMNKDVNVERERDNGLVNVLLVSLVVLSIGALLVLILLRRRE
ncbi:MAG: right-handed parallel beta-helix repeat-containing protein [Thermoplasmatota archaeon]